MMSSIHEYWTVIGLFFFACKNKKIKATRLTETVSFVQNTLRAQTAGLLGDCLNKLDLQQLQHGKFTSLSKDTLLRSLHDLHITSTAEVTEQFRISQQVCVNIWPTYELTGKSEAKTWPEAKMCFLFWETRNRTQCGISPRSMLEL